MSIGGCVPPGSLDLIVMAGTSLLLPWQKLCRYLILCAPAMLILAQQKQSEYERGCSRVDGHSVEGSGCVFPAPHNKQTRIGRAEGVARAAYSNVKAKQAKQCT